MMTIKLCYVYNLRCKKGEGASIPSNLKHYLRLCIQYYIWVLCTFTNMGVIIMTVNLEQFITYVQCSRGKMFYKLEKRSKHQRILQKVDTLEIAKKIIHCSSCWLTKLKYCLKISRTYWSSIKLGTYNLRNILKQFLFLHSRCIYYYHEKLFISWKYF